MTARFPSWCVLLASLILLGSCSEEPRHSQGGEPPNALQQHLSSISPQTVSSERSRPTDSASQNSGKAGNFAEPIAQATKAAAPHPKAFASQNANSTRASQSYKSSQAGSALSSPRTAATSDVSPRNSAPSAASSAPQSMPQDIEIESATTPLAFRIPETGETPLTQDEVDTIGTAMDQFEQKISQTAPKEEFDPQYFSVWEDASAASDDILRGTLGFDKFHSLSREAVLADATEQKKK